ncbi:flagellin [Carnobacterium inhibens]|uniref:Flagellin n=1 Tax=Carnobacterium inhibens subsp. gilichinskyi TaxID=1266845 RepID=U5SAS1_9LACT|nr:flagellin [Carnobacterium inhibens subsp. gilichinskyi]
MRINTNTAAMNTYSNLTSANASKSSSLAKLSSGLRINKAGDDAAGLAISEKMKNQISGMTQASRNAQDGISLIQTAEGALGETHSILNRMRDLTVQAANGTNTDDDKTAIQSELTSLTKEIDRIAEDTEFNTQGLMNATDGVSVASLNKSGVDKAVLETAYETKIDATDLAGDEQKLSDGLSKLSDADLDKVITEYNAVKTASVRAGSEPAPAIVLTAGAYTEDTTVTTNAAFNIVDKDQQDAIAKAYNEVAGNTTAESKKTYAQIGTISKDEADDVIEKYNENEQKRFDLGKLDQAKLVSGAAIEKLDIQKTDSKEFTFQIGANAGEKISVKINNMSTKGLGISDINVTDKDADTDTILGKLDEAISTVSSQRADLGAVQNRLDHTVSNLATTKENLSEANSRITDVDMAEEMMSFTKSNILSQASTSMLAQANQMPQSVLSLLQ